jgi:hypothetical protein
MERHASGPRARVRVRVASRFGSRPLALGTRRRGRAGARLFAVKLLDQTPADLREERSGDVRGRGVSEASRGERAGCAIDAPIFGVVSSRRGRTGHGGSRRVPSTRPSRRGSPSAGAAASNPRRPWHCFPRDEVCAAPDGERENIGRLGLLEDDEREHRLNSFDITAFDSVPPVVLSTDGALFDSRDPLSRPRHS